MTTDAAIMADLNFGGIDKANPRATTKTMLRMVIISLQVKILPCLRALLSGQSLVCSNLGSNTRHPSSTGQKRASRLDIDGLGVLSLYIFQLTSPRLFFAPLSRTDVS